MSSKPGLEYLATMRISIFMVVWNQEYLRQDLQAKKHMLIVIVLFYKSQILCDWKLTVVPEQIFISSTAHIIERNQEILGIINAKC